jgi:hypothetical protein
VKHIVPAALAVAVAVSAAAWAVPLTGDIPAALRPSPGESLAATLSAKGVQIYECRTSTKAPGGHAWTFIAPEADLFDADGNQIGLHGAGPFWQAVDGSRIVGHIKARAEAPVRGAIPWLLMTAESTGLAGRFSRVSSIQRIDTSGGTAPSDSCTADMVGVQVRARYTAIYRFFANF